MSINIDVTFYTKENVTKEFVRNVFKAVIKSGGKYDKKIKVGTKEVEFTDFRLPGFPTPLSIYISLYDEYTEVCVCNLSYSSLTKNHANEDLFFKMLKNIIKATNPVYGIGDTDVVLETYGYMTDYIKKVSIPYPAWILFLGPDFLKKYGEKKLLKTPALIAEKVGNGVFIVLKYYGMGTEADQRKAEKEKDYEVEAGKYLTELFKIE